MPLSFLRQQTAEAHKRLESRLNLFEKVNSLAAYGDHLKRMHECLRQVEGSVEKFETELPLDWSDRKKLSWLEQDLAALKLNSPKSTTPTFSPCENIAEAMGALYVMEGSTLGGRVICGHFENALGLNELNGLRYFSGYGEKTGAKWKEFLRALESFMAASPENAALVSGSAKRTFHFYENTLCQPT